MEYHQLTMQDVVYVDEGIEEVTEVFSNSPNQILSRADSINSPPSFEHSSAAPLSAMPTTKPPAIVVPDACPIIPMPPTPSTRVTMGVISLDARASMHSYTGDGDDNQPS